MVENGQQQVGLDVVLSQSCYFAGDVVRCRVYFFFAEPEPEAKKREKTVMLEWVTVQLHGHVAFDPHLVSPSDAADVAEEAEAGFDPDDREKRLRQAHESGIIHRADDCMHVVNKSRTTTQVDKAGTQERGRSSSFSEVNLVGLDAYDDSQEFLSAISSFTSQSMPDVTLLAGKYGSCLFASPAEVVTCAFTAKVGTEVAFAYEARLPAFIPPSYKGLAARYFYVLTVGCKLGNRDKAYILHVPVRVCATIGHPSPEKSPPSGDLNGERGEKYTGSKSSDSKEEDGKSKKGHSRLRSFSSFLLEDHDYHVRSWVLGVTSFKRNRGIKGGGSERFAAASVNLPVSVNPKQHKFNVVDFDSTGYLEKDKLEALSNQPDRRTGLNGGQRSNGDTVSQSTISAAIAGGCATPRTVGEQIFRIGSESRHMASLHMFKDTVCPGEQLLLYFDFSKSVVPCYQVTVALELEERSKCPAPLQAAFQPLMAFDRGGRRAPGGKADFEDPQSFGVGPWTRILRSRTIQVGFNKNRSVILSIPSDATPDFETDLITVKSYLRFEFVTARFPQKGWGDLENGGEDITPAQGKISLPVTNKDTQTSPWRIPIRLLPPTEYYRKTDEDEDCILLLSSSTQSSMLHVRIWL